MAFPPIRPTVSPSGLSKCYQAQLILVWTLYFPVRTDRQLNYHA